MIILRRSVKNNDCFIDTTFFCSRNVSVGVVVPIRVLAMGKIDPPPTKTQWKYKITFL